MFYSQIIETWDPTTEGYRWHEHSKVSSKLKEIIKEFSKENFGFFFDSKREAKQAAKIIKVLNDIEDFEENSPHDKIYAEESQIYLCSKNGDFEKI